MGSREKKAGLVFVGVQRMGEVAEAQVLSISPRKLVVCEVLVDVVNPMLPGVLAVGPAVDECAVTPYRPADLDESSTRDPARRLPRLTCQQRSPEAGCVEPCLMSESDNNKSPTFSLLSSPATVVSPPLT
uniref:Putative sodium/potassium-transporting atpase subunit beta-2 n=1 Tax=Ixodes ricinus TaxID=34613 RepID=A0A0K8RBS2_IXORI